MIMDSFAALGLATDSPTDELLDRPPVPVKENIITYFMWQGVLFNAFCQFVFLMFILEFTPSVLGIPSTIRVKEWNFENGQHYTFFFHVFVFLQLFNFVNCRMLKKEELNIFNGIFNNWIFWLICFLTFFGEMLFVELGGMPCRVAPLPLWMHLLALLCGMMSWVFCFINKMLPSTLIWVPAWLANGEVILDEELTEERQENNFMGSIKKPFDVRTGMRSFQNNKK